MLNGNIFFPTAKSRIKLKVAFGCDKKNYNFVKQKVNKSGEKSVNNCFNAKSCSVACACAESHISICLLKPVICYPNLCLWISQNYTKSVKSEVDVVV